MDAPSSAVQRVQVLHPAVLVDFGKLLLMANYRTTVVCRQCGVRAPREKAHLYFEMTTEGSWRHYCEECLAKITHVSCSCGKRVPIAEAPEHFHRRSKTPSGFDYTCKECKERAASQREHSSSRIRIGKKTPKILSVNGCKLVPALNGRCDNFLDCTHYDDCLDRVAVLGWPGWSVK